ncbi:diphosphomevalonate decarboxylase [Pimephales promelas]|nr:diphosphomevalonate decarboxylase [Pimephales promelas]
MTEDVGGDGTCGNHRQWWKCVRRYVRKCVGGNAMLPSRPITDLAVRVVATCSYIFEEVRVRRRRRVRGMGRICAYATPSLLRAPYAELKTTTTIACNRSFQQDRIWLNGKEEDISCPRLQLCLQEIRRLARKRRNTGGPTSDISVMSHKVHICSVNNFPTAAGLASSAAGYACLVYTLSKLFNVEGELSTVARLGSGSACRSLYGGFVQWKMGERSDGEDSIAEQVESESYWPELRVLILVIPHGSVPSAENSLCRLCFTRFDMLNRLRAVAERENSD